MRIPIGILLILLLILLLIIGNTYFCQGSRLSVALEVLIAICRKSKERVHAKVIRDGFS